MLGFKFVLKYVAKTMKIFTSDFSDMRIHKTKYILINSHVVSSYLTHRIIMIVSDSLVPETCMGDSLCFLVENKIMSV